MKSKQQSFLKICFTGLTALFCLVTVAHSANVTLAWDANDPEPEGYRVFAREEGQSYDYQYPLWEGDETTCTLAGLVEGITYYFVVRAFEGTLESADSEEVSYTPAATGLNQSPSASAGDSQTVYEDDAVALDGTASSDSDGSIVSYLWEQTGGTSITISNSSQALATFTAPVVDADGETLTFSLTVTDDDGNTSVATTTVNVLKSDSTDADSEEASDTPAEIGVNQSPSASAGDSQTVYEGDAVTLDGTASSDSDGSIVSYLWAQTGGTSITVSNSSQAQATFTAPVVDADGETLTFSLTVTDNDGNTSVATTTVNVLKSDSTDVDGDNVPDVLDAFPEDPTEWADNDSDGVGDNEDSDDDNDGMSDQWESEYGLDPYTDDAGLDADGDGVSNLDEYEAQTDPVASPTNTAPDAPVIETVYTDAFVDLTPVLVSGAYFDPDSDDHYQSQWQISTEVDFPDSSAMVLDETTTTQLTAYQVGEMVLDYDTVYYWRVRFVDARSGESDWSEVSSFITVESSDDTDTNGIPDDQEVSAIVDLNENGINDILEDDIKLVNTVEGQTVVGVKAVSSNIILFSVKSISSDTVSDQSVAMGFGLIGFKLYLDEVGAAATVTIYFSTAVEEDSQLYKYYSDTGWEIYERSVFAENRKSVTLTLVDGGIGDEDGVANGIIVDPSGISSVDTATTDSASVSTSDSSSSSGGGGGGGCFISTGSEGMGHLGLATTSSVALTAILLLMAAGSLSAAVCRINKKGRVDGTR
ncbi:fibronectin type III domain-containing protein [Desulfosarcina ovata]|uniref:Fibronectin type-III domain-containing protein n=1 Tax=Desulfosarcina ovata subsp. ovata TaxID=2752305 RepID=A0A5K8A7M6_9BACT|nr:fibronectin type III domain-containing protein [Desulfosarcina ovata]BBO88643.1 hypothetical protein DSCOOX_18230 [Desulfosarcina ovata subsp. ovata]